MQYDVLAASESKGGGHVFSQLPADFQALKNRLLQSPNQSLLSDVQADNEILYLKFKDFLLKPNRFKQVSYNSAQTVAMQQ